jgi:dTMP kinase
MSGMFITFEGIDGSGKSTQLIRLKDTLTDAGHSVLVTRNPGGTELGMQLRKILLHHPGYVDPMCEMMLYMADRAQHITEVIEPALAEGKIVLCDRFVDSTLAYQGYGRGLALDAIWQMNDLATRKRLPDLTFLFDGPVEVLASRVSQRGEADRLEREALSFREKVREGYLALAQADPNRIKVLDATHGIEGLSEQVLQIFENHFSKEFESIQ